MFVLPRVLWLFVLVVLLRFAGFVLCLVVCYDFEGGFGGWLGRVFVLHLVVGLCGWAVLVYCLFCKLVTC